MDWQKRVWQYSAAAYQEDLRTGIELLTEAFRNKLDLIPQMGKEWEFILTVDGFSELEMREKLRVLIQEINAKIENTNCKLLKLGHGSGYERLYIDNPRPLANGEDKILILEITTQITNPYHSAMLIDLFQRMLRKELEGYGFNKDVLLLGGKRNITCCLNDNISFLKPNSMDGSFYPPTENSVEWTAIMNAVLAATPEIMLLFAPKEALYERFGPIHPSPPKQLSYGEKIPNARHAYCLRTKEGEPHLTRIENRLPNADADPFEVTLGTLLVFYNALRLDPIELGLLNDTKAGLRSLDESLALFRDSTLLKRTLDELDPSKMLGTRLQQAIIHSRDPVGTQR